MPGAEEADPEPGADPRLRLLGAYVARSLRPAAGAWERCAGTAEAERLLHAFLGREDAGSPQPLLVVRPGPGGLALRPGLDAGPEAGPPRAKGLFFLRTGPEPPGPRSLRGAVLCGDVPAAPLKHLAALFSQVVVPVLANEKNHRGWPHVVCQDVQRHAHGLQGDLLVILEQVNGKTVLPLPAGADEVGFVDSDSDSALDCTEKSVIYAIESAVIQWSRRVQGVLKRESSQPLLQGENPTPRTELEFWKSRSVFRRHPPHPAFQTLLQELMTSSCRDEPPDALTEAQDIRTHLMPLSRHLEILESLEFPEVKPRLRPLLHVVCLIWATCGSYRSPGRLTVLLQEICNLLIQQASNYLNPEGLLRSEVEESQRKLQVVMETLNFFKQMFQDRRENLHTYFKENQEVKEWDFQSSLVFVRLDGFLGRLLLVQDLLKTTLDFHTLGKLEFSGIRGSALSRQVQQMYDEFQEMYRVFTEAPYDCLDPQSTEFENDVSEFRQRVEDLDRGLGTIFIQAFDDAPGLEHAFKLLDLAGNLLERPLIAQDASEKYLLFVRMFHKDLDTVRVIYSQRVQEEAELGFAAVHKNMPTVAGGLRWAQELRQRIQGPFASFRRIAHPCLESAEGKQMTQKYEDMLSLLDKYETRLYEDWCQTVSEKSQYNLSQPLLKRDPETKQIAVNFKPQLTSVLKEMSYLESRQMRHVPETAAAMFSSREFYRQLVAKLEVMANWYNRIMKTLVDVELPLLEKELGNIDLCLKAAEETLNWKTEGIWDYVIQITNSVHDLEQRIQKAQDNVEEIQNIMKTWVSPIFKRKDGKKECLLSMDDQRNRMERYYDLIKESGLKIHALVQENLGLFAADPTSNIWKAYVKYIDDMLLDGFFLAIECSLKYLLENTESKAGVTPIFEAQLCLVIPELVFSPSLESGVKGGFYDTIEGLVANIFGISSLVPRLSPQDGSLHYQVDMEGMAHLASLRSTLLDRVQSMMALCSGYRNTFSQYSYLYVEDRKEVLSQFLLYGRVLTPEEMEAHIDDGLPENPPLLHQFKAQIDSYEKLYEEVCGLEPVKVFDGWMKIDVRPLKASLLNLIKRWSLMFKQHLVDHVTNSLADLEVFIRNTESGMLKKVEKGDFKGLVEIMGHLMALKERQNSTDEMFEPLKHTIELLKTYEQELPETVFKQLEELPEQWDNVKKLAIAVRQQVAPLQANEVAALRQRCSAFDVEQQQFWERFRKEAPFRFNSVAPHRELDARHTEIRQMELTLASISESAALFEVSIPNYKQLNQCRREVCLLKELWDTIGMVTSSIHAWETAPWREVNVEAMDRECKQFARCIRNLDKEVRAWDAFAGLESTVSDALSSLRAVAELQSPAIRERHWRQLVQATGVSFTVDEGTTLADLLRVQLHHFEDEVRSIADKAVKEMGTEETLTELCATWAGLEFRYEPHPRTGVPQLRSDEDLLELLEDNQVQLQNLMTSKHVAFFLEEVSGWQKRLSTADAVISTWFDVQRTWSHLESIFMGSEDIRAQLPQVPAKEIPLVLLPYPSRGRRSLSARSSRPCPPLPGLASTRRHLQRTSASQAATSQAEGKREGEMHTHQCVPGWLGKRKEGRLVQRHLSKLFDNMAKMEFQLDASEKATKISLGMYSKEGEYVAFSEPCDCSGQVEIWLNHVLAHMKATVRHGMTEGVVAYEEKPREQWLFDYPAQVALTCTQIWWTTEVGIAFARLEEGYENALKDYYRKQVVQLKTLITMLLGQLSEGDRQKIMTICTVDVHARDVVAKMIAQKVDNAQAFLWLSQLRHRWDDEAKHCFANICDAQFLYSYEYLGNTPRLVITPLTDRCYITLTQSLHLTMSGAPAGPAGTGKTETTKDLGRALGVMVYVFNCSEQMDYKSCGNIYKGLAQTGAWGCFDEFNRISVEVLSVVAVQVWGSEVGGRPWACCQHCESRHLLAFNPACPLPCPLPPLHFTSLPSSALCYNMSRSPDPVPTCYYHPSPWTRQLTSHILHHFIPKLEVLDETIAKGQVFVLTDASVRDRSQCLLSYQHRPPSAMVRKTILALCPLVHRPCAMVVPDFELICEIMLVAEGFIEARALARKFITLYRLCKELLSKQDHYDWGLRAIKSVLVVAGSLKRGDPDRPEDQVLMRSLRDFNIPKIVTDDVPVFMGLIGDLFPALDVPRRRDLNFEALVRKAVVELKLQAEDNFVLKVAQLEELLAVRHSVFVVGNAGSGKSQVLKSLHKTHQIMKRRPVWVDLNPKAVTNDELFGVINPATREWKDGLFSSIMRELANITHDGPKWILLDGDIDPMWIESLNTVMDDNKVLTLASNERIPLSPTMRLLFEISHLRTATPATVSRAGILYINPTDLGWNPPVSSWIDRREVQTERANLTILFDKYLPTCLDTLRTRFKKTIPIPEQSMVQMLCYLLECLLTTEDIPADCPKETYELYFVFAAIWAFGGAMAQDQILVGKGEFPRAGQCLKLGIGRLRISHCLLQSSVLLHGLLLGGKDSGRVDETSPSPEIQKSLRNYEQIQCAVVYGLLPGAAVLEKPLEKKAGRNYGPPGNKKLIYFIDDMNLPEVDAYGTVQPHTIIRQHLDYGHWYDRNKLSLKEIRNVQYVSCMNPTAGSFTINPRLQRHFSVLVLSFPGADALASIYGTILTQHLKLGNFPESLQKSSPQLINLALTFHRKITTTFLPTAIKFHYVFNLRDLANIFQGILFSSVECVKSTQDLVKLYLHESSRVYRDKLVEEKDFDLFDKEAHRLFAPHNLLLSPQTNLTELKSFGTPPLAVSNVTAAVMTLIAPGGKVPKDRSWKAAKVSMAKVDSFLDSLVNFDKENIHENCLKAIRPYLQDPEFNPEFVATKSHAAAGLCSWVINIVKFYEVFCDVEPKRQALSRATSDLTAAQEKLAAIKAKITHLNENLAKLTAKFEKATADKLRCQQEAEATAGIISLANRLVRGLASENVRWAEAVQNLRQQESKLCGDVLLTTAFVSYLGFFTKGYRQSLMDGTWRPYLSQLKVPIPVTPTLDPLRMLTDEADVAAWQNQGLPADRMSVENATIVVTCERWPLVVDPQLQGMKWIKNKYGENLRVTRIGQKGYLQTIERALEAGDVVLIENLEESVDPVLGPLLGREVIKKGRFVKIGDKECEYNPSFRLLLHTKLANPHYQPELQSDLTKQQNGFKITLKTLEDNLLSRLSSASGNFLGDTALVENLETTKQTAAEVEKKVQEARVTEVKINEAREHYRPAAARASLLYFIMNDLSKIHPMYQFSLKAFSIVFQKAVEKAAPDESLKARVTNLIDSITFSVYQYTTRGLFECDKLTYLAQLTFQILLTSGEVSVATLDFLLRSPGQTGVTSPVGFLSHQAWGGIKALSSMEEFCNLDRDIEGSAKSWKKFVESECPEKEKFPQEWKDKTALQRLCMMRVMRPDRMTYAIRDFVEEKLGSKYVAGRTPDFAASFEESGPATPMFFILSPGVDPLKDVENQGKKLGYTFNNRNFHNVSLGQGQEVVAEAALDLAAKKGHWVILQNIHLVAKWLSTLEKKLEEHSENSHPEFRVFISAEPAPSPEGHIIPQGILENAIKITNEPPTGMHTNLHKALDNFTQDTLEMCSRETEFKSILFALCYFHGVVAERRKFGPQGWNCPYPFNTGDLTISVNVLYNFLEANAKVPYDDLRYLFGEIMYGGHITDDWDRRLCRTYLEEFIRPEMLEGELCLAPGFPLPGNLDYTGYHQYIDAELPAESPYLYGLHPNAEIGFLTQTSEKLFRTVLELQPRDGHAGEGAGATREEKVKVLLEEILERVTDEFNMPELMARVEEHSPYIVVAFQECERMNILTGEIQRSLRELDLGLKGELTMTSDMENLQNALYLDTVPEPWARRAYPSTAGLGAWFVDLLDRIKELEAWIGDFTMPATVWLTGFFNPQSFLTAIMQSTARKNEWPLDQMTLQCDVTKKNREDFRSAPREGAYIHGLFVEGARWDVQAGVITEAKLKDLTPPMPVMFIKAIPADKQDSRSVYPCPVYKTSQRGPTYVWTFNLKTKEKASKWVLAGVALLLQI
uniref:dynein axonemal heavy chain 9-like n=1 Tax=Panthera onca TaxID=9690 RepID=UPI0029550CD8|nr:dynein axonemal heavy chain 9-like [Panthera onca]